MVQANKMVADERRKMAEVEALLRETEEERDAVRGAMKVVEGENGRLRELSVGAAKALEEAKQAEVEARKSEEVSKDVEEAPEDVEDVPKSVEEPRIVEEQPRVETAELKTQGTEDESEESMQEPATPSSPGSTHEGEILDKAAESLTVDGAQRAHFPSLPSSSSDLWKGQARDRDTTPPKTPPRVHALPVETSPWAERQV